MKISQRISELQTQTVGSTLRWSKFTKGHNSVKKTVGGVMVLNLCTSSDDALYLYQVKKIHVSHRVSELLSGCYLNTEICKGA